MRVPKNVFNWEGDSRSIECRPLLQSDKVTMRLRTVSPRQRHITACPALG